MKGRLPKDPAIRQRRNKAPGGATLTDEPERKRRVPSLPKRLKEDGTEKPWHEMTRKWWRDVWRSPMADEYLVADTHGLYRLAVLVDAYWREPTAGLAAEIRLQQTCFGLTPLDRRRLQWEVEKVEQATKGRMPPPSPVEPSGPVEDPRKALRLLP